ncbi:MAG: DUF2208 family protein [Zestosphaera sp.]
MAYVQSRKQLLVSTVYSQVLILTLATVNVFYPEYYQYTFILFFLAAMVFTTWSVRKSRVGGKVSPEEVRGGRLLLKSSRSDVMELQSKDSELVAELKPMLKLSMLNLAILPVFFIWYWAYFQFINALTIVEVSEYRFLAYLIGYEVPFALVQAVNLMSRRSVRVMVQVVSEYEVYDKGVLGTGIALKFPFGESKYKVEVNTKRMFVDLVQTSSGKSVVKLRFYSKNPERLHEIFRRYGLQP